MQRDLILVIISLVIWGTGEGMFIFFQPLYLEELGANPIEIGSILGMVGMAMALVHIPAGYLADRYGRRKLLWAAWIGGTIAAWVMALSTNITGFTIGAILYGITAFVAGPLSSYVTASRGKMTTARALTFTSAAYNFGAILGPLVGGWIGKNLGFRQVFLVAALIFMLSTTTIFFLRKQPVETSVSENPTGSIKLLINAKFLIFISIIFISFLAMYLPQPLAQNFLKNEKGLDLLQIGQLLSLRSLGIVISNLLLGRLLPQIGFLIAQINLILFSTLIWQGSGTFAFGAGYFLLGSYQTARIFANAQAREHVEARIMGLTFGVVETAITISVVLAPPIAGLVYKVNPSFIYPISIGLIGITIIVNLIYQNRK